MKAIETIRLYFTKRFDSGLLQGLSVHSSISFPASETVRYSKRFQRGATGRDLITKARWTITDASFQNYVR